MKGKIIVMLILGVSLLPLTGLATNKCGTGPYVVGQKNSLLHNMFATTIDNTSGITNSFSITTGTSGCSNSGFAAKERRRENYVANAFENLQEEIAQGEGPYVDSLVKIMGCSDQSREIFIEQAQQDFEVLFASDINSKDSELARKRSQEFLNVIRGSIDSNSALRSQCSLS